MSVFLQRAYAIGASYEDLEFQTHLLNAIPDLFTFLAYQRMSPHSNDVEREIRDGIIPQRNVRHKTMTKKAVFRCQTSSHSHAHATDRKSRLAGRSEYLHDHNWNIFEKAKDTPYSLVNPDGTRYSIFGAPGPPQDEAYVATAT